MNDQLVQAVDYALAVEDSELLLNTIREFRQWKQLPSSETSQILKQIAMHGYSGRTDRYKVGVQEILASGGAPDVFACAFLQLNDSIAQLIATDKSWLEATDRNGNSLLHCAAERGNAELVYLLCNRRVAVDTLNHRGQTPLDLALHAGPWKPSPAIDVVEWLKRFGATVDFHAAAMLGDCAGIIRWVKHDRVDVNAYDRGNRTALFHSAKNGHETAVRTLLDLGADPNRACGDGQTPIATACLHMLSQECPQQVVEDLIEFGAVETLESAIVLESLSQIDQAIARDPEILKGQDHESALGYAIHVWRPESLKRLLELGALPSRENWAHIERIAGGHRSLVAELRAIAPRKD